MSSTVSISAVGEKPPPVSLSAVEEAITVTSPTHPKPWIVQLVSSSDWLYNSVSGQADPMPVKANQVLTLQLRDAKSLTFYASTASTAKLHVLVLA